MESDTVRLKHVWCYVTPWAGNLTEQKSIVFNKISRMGTYIPIAKSK
jgi:hypothetical protein